MKTTTDAHKIEKLHVKCVEADGPAHPHCEHGPTLLFYREVEDDGFYACAAHRNRNSCSFQQLYTKHAELGLSNPTKQVKQQQKESKSIAATYNYYCVSCKGLVPEVQQQHATHKWLKLNQKLRSDPTQFLPPLDNDAEHAQYFFDAKALKFFAQTFKQLQISKVVCIGAPRLHGYLRTQCAAVHSYLLDFDKRFEDFYDNKEYAWYNMCNNYFFRETDRLEFENFLKCKTGERLLLFTDPPFGCRTEPIAHTLHELIRLHNHINQLPHQTLPIFWIFPYFSAPYIQQFMPELEMCDYKINYTNHEAYTDVGNKSRKLGSPVRIFTNVPMELLTLPAAELYSYCAICKRYKAAENRHCTACGICPSKNGATYRHCLACGTCVKPNYVHCFNCRRCTQKEHDCLKYHAPCWICSHSGHNELQCKLLEKLHKQNTLRTLLKRAKHARKIICLLCSRSGHNERNCRKRSKLLHEFKFLGNTERSLN